MSAAKGTATNRKQTRNLNPYTPEEKRQLKNWHAKATKTRSTTPPNAPERKAGDKFAKAIMAKREEGFLWKELAEPLGIAPRTLSAFVGRRIDDENVEPGRPKYKGTSVNTRFRTKTYFPCGIHRIGVDPEYPPSRPGGPVRDAICERARRKKRYADQKAATEATKAAQRAGQRRRKQGEAA